MVCVLSGCVDIVGDVEIYELSPCVDKEEGGEGGGGVIRWIERES